MRLIIAGGRDYVLSDADYGRLGEILNVAEVVSGGARGVDSQGEAWAVENGIKVVRFLADWGRYRRAAGPIRNREMAAYADTLALFPGGSGTENMYEEARNAGILIYDFR